MMYTGILSHARAIAWAEQPSNREPGKPGAGAHRKTATNTHPDMDTTPASGTVCCSPKIRDIAPPCENPLTTILSAGMPAAISLATKSPMIFLDSSRPAACERNRPAWVSTRSARSQHMRTPGNALPHTTVHGGTHRGHAPQKDAIPFRPCGCPVIQYRTMMSCCSLAEQV